MIASIEQRGKYHKISDPITMKLEEKHQMRGFYTVKADVKDVPCQIYCVVEMPDSQMSFQLLSWNDKKKAFEFKAFRDVHPRSDETALPSTVDPVVKYCQVIGKRDM